MKESAAIKELNAMEKKGMECNEGTQWNGMECNGKFHEGNAMKEWNAMKECTATEESNVMEKQGMEFNERLEWN